MPRVIFSCKITKCCQNQFLTSISTLLDIFSQLATFQPAPGPFKEYPCAHGRKTGHRNKPWGKQTEEECTANSHQLLADGCEAIGWWWK